MTNKLREKRREILKEFTFRLIGEHQYDYAKDICDVDIEKTLAKLERLDSEEKDGGK